MIGAGLIALPTGDHNVGELVGAAGRQRDQVVEGDGVSVVGGTVPRDGTMTPIAAPMLSAPQAISPAAMPVDVIADGLRGAAMGSMFHGCRAPSKGVGEPERWSAIMVEGTVLS